MTESATITLSITHLPGKGGAVDDFFISILPDTRKYPGCHFVHAYRHATDENRVILIEEWDSIAAYEGYFAWRQSSGTLAPLGPLLAGPPQIDFWAHKIS
ncbi:MAG TPA: antibiotic biosynthesis monooxygenase [Stellaceae bacterium]|nr:antibiotic biosynthesis monooxygenase [Stellaceae bacterium]